MSSYIHTFDIWWTIFQKKISNKGIYTYLRFPVTSPWWSSRHWKGWADCPNFFFKATTHSPKDKQNSCCIMMIRLFMYAKSTLKITIIALSWAKHQMHTQWNYTLAIKCSCIMFTYIYNVDSLLIGWLVYNV